MTALVSTHPTARALAAALDQGDLPGLRALLAEHPGLADAVVVTADGPAAGGRTPLHLLADWPARRPHAAETARALVDAGAAVDAPFEGRHRETPLHWAASADDLPLVDALLDLGARPDAPGSSLDGAGPLSNAVAFACWGAARRLVERGAHPALWHAAALGLLAAARAALDDATSDERTRALWHAARAGQPATAALLLAAGADPTWVGWDGQTALEVARRAGAADVVALLERTPAPRGG